MLTCVSRDRAITATIKVLAAPSKIRQLPAPVCWIVSVPRSINPSASSAVSQDSCRCFDASRIPIGFADPARGLRHGTAAPQGRDCPYRCKCALAMLSSRRPNDARNMLALSTLLGSALASRDHPGARGPCRRPAERGRRTRCRGCRRAHGAFARRYSRPRRFWRGLWSLTATLFATGRASTISSSSGLIRNHRRADPGAIGRRCRRLFGDLPPCGLRGRWLGGRTAHPGLSLPQFAL